MSSIYLIRVNEIEKKEKRWKIEMKTKQEKEVNRIENDDQTQWNENEIAKINPSKMFSHLRRRCLAVVFFSTEFSRCSHTVMPSNNYF